jgi:hydroxypyruvate isomerase
MPRFCANLSMMFTEVGFLDRFAAAARAGFAGVEYWLPYAFPKEQVAERLRASGLTQALFNLPTGDWDAGERGIAVMPDRAGEFRDGVGLAIEYAKALGCTRLNCLAGKTPAGADPAKVHDTLVENLRFAARHLAKAGLTLCVEAVNTQDVPGFHLTTTRQALGVIDEVAEPNVAYLFDIYHMQIMEGNLIKTMRDHVARIGHVQIADNPGRHEPGTGEINFPNVFGAMDEAGYAGWVGCEYRPKGATAEGLGWLRPYTRRASAG